MRTNKLRPKVIVQHLILDPSAAITTCLFCSLTAGKLLPFSQNSISKFGHGDRRWLIAKPRLAAGVRVHHKHAGWGRGRGSVQAGLSAAAPHWENYFFMCACRGETTIKPQRDVICHILTQCIRFHFTLN